MSDGSKTVEKLPGEGDVRIRKEIRRRHECEECGEPATRKHTFLYDNARSNPASKGFGRDDISWCADASSFSCDEHERKLQNDPPNGMRWCSTFYGPRFAHLLLFWDEVQDA